MKYYSYRELIDRLAANGLPSSRSYLYPLEHLGIFKKPENVLVIHKPGSEESKQVNKKMYRDNMRIFTDQELNEAVESIRRYVNAQKNEAPTS